MQWGNKLICLFSILIFITVTVSDTITLTEDDMNIVTVLYCKQNAIYCNYSPAGLGYASGHPANITSDVLSGHSAGCTVHCGISSPGVPLQQCGHRHLPSLREELCIGRVGGHVPCQIGFRKGE